MNNKHIHVLMLCEYFMPFDRGGSEWSVYYLAKSLLKNKISVSVFTPNYGVKKHENIEGINVYRFPFLIKLQNKNKTITPFFFSNIIWFVSILLFLFFYARQNKITHLHIQGKYFLPSTIVIGKILKIPVITTIRDYIILCPHAYCLHSSDAACISMGDFLYRDIFLVSRLKGSTLPSLFFLIVSIYGKFVSYILQYFLKKSDRVIAISQKVSDIYENAKIDIDEVIYNTNPISPLIKSGRQYILYVGRLTYGKGVELLLSSYYLAKEKNTKLPPLYIIGEGPLSKKLTKQVCSSIKVIPHLPHSQIFKYMSRAFFVIMPSIWPEPFGRVALESIAAGVPVLATSNGGLPEVVMTRKNGLLVEANEEALANGLLNIYRKHKDFRSFIKKNKSNFVNKFVIHPIDQYVKLYQSL